MRKYCTQIFIVLLLFSGVAAAQQMQPFTSPDGHFSVLFPGKPQLDSSQNSDGSVFTSFWFYIDDGNVGFFVDHDDFPPGVMKAGDPQALLKTVRDGLAGGKTIAGDVEIDLNGVPGRAFSFVDQKGMTSEIHLFLTGNRVYEVEVDINKGYDAPLADQFMNSFKIL